jgi:arginyl-tRNA synthetase
MDPQFQELATEIADAVEKRLSGAFEERIKTHFEERIKTHFEERIKDHIDKFEQRAETRMRMHFENLESQVKLAAEGYGATLEGIERRLTEINTKFDTKFGEHDRVLADHNGRITTLENRP